MLKASLQMDNFSNREWGGGPEVSSYTGIFCSYTFVLMLKTKITVLQKISLFHDCRATTLLESSCIDLAFYNSFIPIPKELGVEELGVEELRVEELRVEELGVKGGRKPRGAGLAGRDWGERRDRSISKLSK